MSIYFKRNKNLFSILTAVIVIGGFIFSSCESAAKDTANKVTVVSEKPNTADGEGEKTGNDSSEKKSAKESDKSGLIEVYDGRNVEEGKDVSDAEKQFAEKEFKAKESEIMQKTKLECDEDAAEGIDIVDIAEGAFTKPDSSQKAYLYERCRAGRSFGIGGVMIVENQKVEAHYIFGENGLYSAIVSEPDFNKNGLSELALIGGGTGQGYTASAIELFEFNGGKLDFLGRAETYTDNSGAVENEKDIKTIAYKIFVSPAKNPEFSRETYQKNVKTEKWDLMKKDEKFSLDKKDAPKVAKIT